MNEWLETIARLLTQNIWAAPVLCLAAGVITSFTPCSLSTIPMVLTYVGAAAKENTRRAFTVSLTMALGMACTLGVFGSIASAIGHFMHHRCRAVRGKNAAQGSCQKRPDISPFLIVPFQMDMGNNMYHFPCLQSHQNHQDAQEDAPPLSRMMHEMANS